MTTDEQKAMALEIAGCILEDYRFKRLLRETVLHILLEQEEIRERGAVRAFFDSCQYRKVKVEMAKDSDKLIWTNQRNLGDDLRAVFVLYRDRIIARLRDLRDAEERAERRRQREEQSQQAANGQQQPKRTP